MSENLLKNASDILVCKEKIFVANSGADEVLIASMSGVVRNIIRDVVAPKAISFANDKLYIASSGADQVVLIKDSFSNMELLINKTKTPNSLLALDDRLIVAASGVIYQLDLASNKPSKLLGDLSEPKSLCMSADQLHFVDNGELFVVADQEAKRASDQEGIVDIADHNGKILIAFEEKVISDQEAVFESDQAIRSISVDNDKLYILIENNDEVQIVDLASGEKSSVPIAVLAGYSLTKDNIEESF